jgi:inhibitor of growth protein 5/inhibitor of growth protein 4
MFIFIIFINFLYKCDVEWFHIACVDLKTVPKGKWYCDNCSKYKGKQRRA